jgi:hypothetical protein
MKNTSLAVGIDKHYALFKDLLGKTLKGKGGILAISGESGMGKTFLLQKFNEDCSFRSNIQNAYVENQNVVGNVQLGQIQPLLPFSKAIEYIVNKKNGMAEKKFALNVGMTMLASIPLAGDVFYAVKELSKDWRQFKKDKNSENLKKASSASVEFYETIMGMSTQNPVILFLDDMHWCDAQSVELLGLLSEIVHEFPVFIVFAYKKSVIEGKATPLYSFIQQNMSAESVFRHIELDYHNLIQTKEMITNTFPELKIENGFDKWLFEKSMGIPGVTSEYIKYFEKYPEKIKNFDPSDTENNEKFLPTSLNAAFSQALESIGEEDKNILAVCSSEGREFTALITSSLLNLDVLSTIKKLRSLQQRTGIIRSLGAKNRYGVKTTVYEFTQAFYNNYFQSTLEYEENVALHGQIAALLKQRYNEADADAIKSQIAPFLAAHSTESGDDSTAKEMLIKTAAGAMELGDVDMVNSIYNSFKELNIIPDDENPDSQNSGINDLKSLLREIKEAKNEDKDINTSHSKSDEFDFNNFRRQLVQDFHDNNFSGALDKANIAYAKYYDNLMIPEKAQLLALIIRVNTELNDFSSAEKYSDTAFKLLSTIEEPISESFVINSYALLKCKQGKSDEAFSILRRAAQNALDLPPEIKLITLSNIAILMNDINPKKAGRYYKAVMELSSTLKFESLLNDIKG